MVSIPIDKESLLSLMWVNYNNGNDSYDSSYGLAMITIPKEPNISGE